MLIALTGAVGPSPGQRLRRHLDLDQCDVLLDDLVTDGRSVGGVRSAVDDALVQQPGFEVPGELGAEGAQQGAGVLGILKPADLTDVLEALPRLEDAELGPVAVRQTAATGGRKLAQGVGDAAQVLEGAELGRAVLDYPVVPTICQFN